jgi:sugar lactone lactonase YvrE
MRNTLTSIAATAALAITTSAALGQAIEPALFTISGAGDSLVSWTLLPDGTLVEADRIATGNAPADVALSPDGSLLAVTHGTADEIREELRLYRVNADATVSPILTRFVADSPANVAWVNDNVLAVTETKIGPSSVSTYAFDADTITLDYVDGFASGVFSFSLTAADGTIFVESSFDSPNNAITSRQVAPDGTILGGDDVVIGTGGDFVTDLVATSDGRFVYGPGGISGPSDDLLFGFAAAPDGTLSAVPMSPVLTGTRAPAEVAMSPDDAVLYVTNNGLGSTDGRLVAYAIDPVTGELSPTGNSLVLGDRGDAGAIDTLPGYVFHLDGSGADDTRGLEVIAVGPGGSLASLAVYEASGGFTPDALATWVGIPEPTAGAAGLLAAAGLLGRVRRR